MQRLFEEAEWVVKNGRVPWFPFWYKWIVYPIAVVVYYVARARVIKRNQVIDRRSK